MKSKILKMNLILSYHLIIFISTDSFLEALKKKYQGQPDLQHKRKEMREDRFNTNNTGLLHYLQNLENSS